MVRLNKEKTSQISNLNFYLKTLDKGEQTKLKANRRKGIIKIVTEIKKFQIGKQQRESTNPKFIFEKINGIDKILVRLTKKKREVSNY